MKLKDNTVLVTGGATGIGFALASRFHTAGSRVIICGRRPEKLKEAKNKIPALHTHVCDVESAGGRKELLDWVTHEFSELNVLVNNAGIQRRVSLLQAEPWEETQREIAINLEAPIHLCQLFIPHLMKQKNPAFINVTSGLSFSPLAQVPVYSATKAALHSVTLSLRHQLSKTPIEVIEIIPPAVNTDLGGPGLHTFGVPLDEFADSVMKRIDQGETEVAYGMAQASSRASRAELDEAFKRMNARD